MNTQTRLPAIPASSMEDCIFRDLAAFYAMGAGLSVLVGIESNAAEALIEALQDQVFRGYRWNWRR